MRKMESRERKGTYIQEYGLLLLLQQRSSSALGRIIVLPEDVTEDIISFFISYCAMTLVFSLLQENTTWG